MSMDMGNSFIHMITFDFMFKFAFMFDLFLYCVLCLVGFVCIASAVDPDPHPKPFLFLELKITHEHELLIQVKHMNKVKWMKQITCHKSKPMIVLISRRYYTTAFRPVVRR